MFATFGAQGSRRHLPPFWRSQSFSASSCTMRREALFGPMLTHWDEAAAYAVIGRLVSVLS
jgi:hypothetical protein